MIKKQYLKEISITSGRIGRSANNNKNDVMKVQSWLNLYARTHPGSATATAIDGAFGPATELALNNFCKASQIEANGIVNANVFQMLCNPMRDAFEASLSGNSLRELIISAAMAHLDNDAFELTVKSQSNCGPWVRSYMDGNEGQDWFWCMGFVQAIIDQAASSQGKDFRTLMPLSYSCDTVATTGLQKKLLHRFSAIRSNPSLVKPGDVFLVEKSPYDWIHTGIVTAVHEDVFETIEGNTNEDGSNNGIGVYKRTRNFRTSKLDVFSIEPLV